VTLQDLGSIGELIAAVGGIVSLIYLAFQVRQNTVSVHASMFHSATTSAAEGTMISSFNKAGYSPGEIVLQAWGDRDFRITDADGYYIRVSEGVAIHPIESSAAPQNDEHGQ